MGPSGLLDIVASYALREERALAAWTNEPAPPARGAESLGERLDDELRPSEVRDRFRAAAGAPEGKDGEAARRRFRVLAPAYLHRGTERPRAEIAATEDWTTALAVEGDPGRRKDLHHRWVDEHDRLEGARAWLGEEIERLAREAGATTARAFLDAGEARPPDAIHASLTRDAIAPLDDRVAAAARERRSRFRPALPPREHPSDVPPLETMADHAARLDTARIVTALRHLLATAGDDADAGGPRLVRPAQPRARALVFERAGPRPAVAVATTGGPGALLGTLVALGRAAHASSLRRFAGEDVAASLDPAFAAGAGTVFGRLVLSEAFREWCGLSMDPEALRDLVFEIALLPRVAWARLAQEPEVARRATGRDALPDGFTGGPLDDLPAASALRGIAFGALLEDRLMTRFGRRWFLDRAAGRFLRDGRLGEEGETAESMAGELRLGTIDSAPIVDVFRP